MMERIRAMRREVSVQDRRDPATRTLRASSGYSLAELLAVIAIIGLMVLFAGPALADAYKAYKVRAAADNLTTHLRAQRYTAVAQRQTYTVTLNDEAHASAPNQYSFTNAKGKAITVRLVDGVKMETSTPASISFKSNGSSGSSSTESVVISLDINKSRGDRYTINVTPTGTVTSGYATYTP